MGWKEVVGQKTGKTKYVNDETEEECVTRPEGFGTVEDENMEFPESMTEEEIEARKAAALEDPEWAGCGEALGLEIWRVENKWTDNDTPDFGVKRWPTEQTGKFYKGDSYIVLKTSTSLEGEFEWDIHFWIGGESTQDEYCVAAYKTVELECLLGGAPQQHREVMGGESQKFLSYFKTIEYLDGGIESGFRSDEPDVYVPRLLRVTRKHNVTRAFEVPCSVESMSQQDTFVLDAGLAVYVWCGTGSNPFEKSKGGFVQQTLVDSRFGKAQKVDVDDGFWEILNGDEGAVAEEPPSSGEDDVEALAMKKAFQIEGKPARLHSVEWLLTSDEMNTNGVYLIDDGSQIYVWVGKEAPSYLSLHSMEYGNHYKRLSGRLSPVVRVLQGQEKATGLAAALAA